MRLTAGMLITVGTSNVGTHGYFDLTSSHFALLFYCIFLFILFEDRRSHFAAFTTSFFSIAFCEKFLIPLRHHRSFPSQPAHHSPHIYTTQLLVLLGVHQAYIQAPIALLMWITSSQNISEEPQALSRHYS